MKTKPLKSKSGRKGTTTTSSTGSSLSMKYYFDDINRFDLLSREEEIELGTRIQNDRDPEALEQMINANLKLVVKIANDYARYGLSVEDLVSEGNIGLMKAAERFDPTVGVRFSTYSAWWIRQRIKAALGNQSRTIRLPLHVLQKLRDVDKAERALGDELGRDPSDHEIAERQELPRKKLAELRRVTQPVASLDDHSSDDGVDHLNLGAITGDESVIDPAAAAAENDLHAALGRVMSDLNSREREVIAARFGLGGRETQTLEQLGAVFGVTRERVRQIQMKALGKLQSALNHLEQPPAEPVCLRVQPRPIQSIPVLPEAIPA